jgi:hypothetical protein
MLAEDDKDIKKYSLKKPKSIDIVGASQYDKIAFHMLISGVPLKFMRVAGGKRAKGTAIRYDYQHAINEDEHGTDLSDQYRSMVVPDHAFRKYCPLFVLVLSSHTTRWPLKLFFCYLLPQCEVNSFLTHRTIHLEAELEPLPHRNFRDTLVLQLLNYRSKKFSLPAGLKRGRPREDEGAAVVKRPRIDTLAREHVWLKRSERTPDGRVQRLRCRVCSTKASPVRTKMVCSGCGDVGLCSLDCFSAWHSPDRHIKLRNKGKE